MANNKDPRRLPVYIDRSNNRWLADPQTGGPWFVVTPVGGGSVQPGSTTVAGILQLEDSVVSSSVTMAATPNAVRQAFGLAETAGTTATAASINATNAVNDASAALSIANAANSAAASAVSSANAATTAANAATVASNNATAAVANKLDLGGGTITGPLQIGNTAWLSFEGSVDDSFETTLSSVNPTADRAILLPNVDGTLSVLEAEQSWSARQTFLAALGVSNGYGSSNQVLTSQGSGAAPIWRALTIGSASGLPIVTGTGGILEAGTFGDTVGTVCQGNDPRLSDTRTPTDGSVTTGKIADGAVTYAKVLDFDGLVRANRLDQMAPPASDVSLNNRKITGLAAPVSANDAATKAYVDASQQGLDVKDAARVATTGNITLSGTQTIDGVSLVVGNRVLVKNQTTGSQNGLYVVASGAWTRTTDADTDAEVKTGLFVFVNEGTTNASSGWVLSTPNPITLGTTSLHFSQFSGAGQIDAGDGLVKSGTTLNAVGTAGRIVVNSDSIDLASGVVLTPGTFRSVSVDTYGRVVSGTNPTTLSGYGITDAQPLDADLTAIGNISATTGLLRKSAANTWSLDTSAYLTGNQTITFSGDATGSGTTSVSLTLANSGVTAGTFNNSATALSPFTVDAKGRLTVIGSPVTITPAWASISSKPTTLSGFGITDAATSTHVHGNITNSGAIGSTPNLPIITTTGGALTTGTFGTAASTFCQGNDVRLSDTRTPTDGSVTTAKIATGAVTADKIAANAVTTTAISDASVTPGKLSFALQSRTLLFTSSGTWTCPDGVTFATVYVIGGGAGGRTGSSDPPTTAGGYGGVGVGCIPVTPGSTYTITIGAGGDGFASGGTSSFSTVITATGGTTPASGNVNGTPGTCTDVAADIRRGNVSNCVIIHCPQNIVRTTVNSLAAAYSATSTWAPGSGGTNRVGSPNTTGGVGGAVIIMY